MRVESYDFRKPSRLAGELEHRMAAWLQASCGLIAEKCAKKLSLRVEASFRTVETARPSEALSRFAEEVMGYRVAVNADELFTLVILPRRLAIALVAGMLGDAISELPADRELTVVEASLCEFLIQEVLVSIQEAWPGTEPVGVTLRQAEPQPRRSRVFPSDENVAVCSLAFRGSFGEHEWQWIVPQPGLARLFAPPLSSAASLSDTRQQLEGLVHEIPVEVAVKLGTVELHVSQLAKLREGDVVVLDQPVSESLTAAIDGEARYRVWPGRVGSRQAFQIESLVRD